jgi:hypothetical protein
LRASLYRCPANNGSRNLQLFPNPRPATEQARFAEWMAVDARAKQLQKKGKPVLETCSRR